MSSSDSSFSVGNSVSILFPICAIFVWYCQLTLLLGGLWGSGTASGGTGGSGGSTTTTTTGWDGGELGGTLSDELEGDVSSCVIVVSRDWVCRVPEQRF